MLNGCCTRLKIIEFFNKEKLNNCKSLIYKIEKTRFFKKHEIIILPVNIKIAANNALVTLINFQYQVYKRQIILKS